MREGRREEGRKTEEREMRHVGGGERTGVV